MSCEAENWDALLHEQYVSTHRVLDICSWVFKKDIFVLLRFPEMILFHQGYTEHF